MGPASRRAEGRVVDGLHNPGNTRAGRGDYAPTRYVPFGDLRRVGLWMKTQPTALT
jgi:hypothetical protein